MVILLQQKNFGPFRFENEQFEICWGNQRGKLGGITQGKRHSGAFIC